MNSKQRSAIVGLIIIGLLIVGFFGLRTARAFRQFREHRLPPPDGEHMETDVTLIRDWMTVPFISRTYRVPPRILFEAINIPEKGNKEKSLKQLNDEFYPQADGLVLDKIKAVVLANLPPPTPIKTADPTLPGIP